MTSFCSMLDFWYLLPVMNQYTIHNSIGTRVKEAETLVRIMLFSNNLVTFDTDKSIK